MDASKTIARVELYDAVYRKVRLSRSESIGATELVLKEISDCLVRGDAVKLSGFGTFTVRKKNERPGRNPQNGIEVSIKPRRVVIFKASTIVKKQMNAK